MRICKDHWGKMRAKVDALGLSQFVSASGQEAFDRTVRDFESAEEGIPPPASDCDPLLAMNWNFIGRVMGMVGLAVFNDRNVEDGMPENKDEKGFNHLCPLCIVRRDFDAHNTPTGRCGQEKCTIQVEPGETPWDEDWIESCGDAVLKHLVEKGVVKTQ